MDVGCNGRVSDGIFRNSSPSTALEGNSLNIPSPELLSGESVPLHYTIMADDAFPLKEYIQKPYS